MKLAFTRIVTRDVAALAKFYREITGITPKILHEAYVEFPAAGSSLAISSQATMDSHGARATSAASNRSVVLDFQVEDVDREHARIRQLGTDIVLEPTDQPWGNRSTMFRDPDGNLINFYAPIQDPADRGKRI
jgi:uncharacterized glyoxalase superfamily protein PhnB